MERHELDNLTQEWLRRGLSRRALLRTLAAGAGLVTMEAALAACGATGTSPTAGPAGGGAGPTAALPTVVANPGAPAATTPGAPTVVTAATQPAGAPPADFVRNATLTIPIVTTLDINIDPHKTINSLLYGNLLPNVFNGLVRYDKDAKVVPELAERWEKSADGLTYTFHIRKNAKWATGRDVVADDFIYSWKRTLDPKKPSPTAHFMEHIKGYDEFLKGDAKELEGAKKVDDKTIQIVLKKPYNFFLGYLAIYPWYIVDREAIEKWNGGDINSVEWTNHQPYGTGPWKVTKFDPTQGIEMAPNEHYWGGTSPSITKLSWPILRGPTGPNTALNLYKTGEAQMVGNFPLALLDAVEREFSKEMLRVTVGGTQSLAFDFKKKPFDNVLVRRAFGMAIDRETWASQVWRGIRKPTTAFIPPAVPNYTPPEGIKFNAEEAKKVLAAAGFPNGQGLPKVTIYGNYSDTPAEDVNRWRWVADQWKKILGADVDVDTSMTSTQYLDERRNRKGYQCEIRGWINIQETPELMSEVFRDNSPYMKDVFDWGIQVEPKTYEGVTYDATADARKFNELVNQADVEQDPQKRNDLYRQCEELVLRNAVYVPLGNFIALQLVKPQVKGLQWGAYHYFFPEVLGKDVVITR